MNRIAQLNINLDQLSQRAAPDLAGRRIGTIIREVVSDYFLPAAGMVMFIFLLMGGYQIMTAAGNPKQVAAGQAKIQNAIVGFIIAFVAYWIIQAVITAFGLTTVTEFN